MVIIEYQWCNIPHEPGDGGCNTPVREYNLPDEQRAKWEEFFEWLVAEGVIESFEIRN